MLVRFGVNQGLCIRQISYNLLEAQSQSWVPCRASVAGERAPIVIDRLGFEEHDLQTFTRPDWD